MGSISQKIQLPVIDFNIGRAGVDKLIPECSEWEALKVQLKHALEEFGCFQALFDGVPMDLCKEMLRSARELFDLPLEVKLRYKQVKPPTGYFGKHPSMPLFESIGIKDADQIEKVDEVTNCLWPEGHPTISKTMNSYTKKLSKLGQIIRRMILEILGVEQYLVEHLNSTYYLLRANKYNEPQTSKKILGVSEHTDKSMMTILYQDQVGGLEFQTKDGEWINVTPSPYSFIVIVGDSLYAWANGRLSSPYHRVMISGNDARYSIVLFMTPRDGYMVTPPEELVDEEHPLLFKPFNYDMLMKGGAQKRICPQDFE